MVKMLASMNQLLRDELSLDESNRESKSSFLIFFKFETINVNLALNIPDDS